MRYLKKYENSEWFEQPEYFRDEISNMLSNFCEEFGGIEIGDIQDEIFEYECGYYQAAIESIEISSITVHYIGDEFDIYHEYEDVEYSEVPVDVLIELFDLITKNYNKLRIKKDVKKFNL